MIRPVMVALLFAAGVAFIIVAAVGVARLPDVFQRMHAATKAGGIGASLVLLGLAAPSLLWAQPAGSGERTHVVRKGENLTLIAQRYGVPVSTLAATRSPAARATLRDTPNTPRP